jgi:hypothetical protein
MSFLVITNPTFNFVDNVVEGFCSSPYDSFDEACDWAASGYAAEACVVDANDIMTPLFGCHPEALSHFLDNISVGPISTTFWDRIKGAPPHILVSIRRKLEECQANAWCFGADPRHFWQFAGPAEVKALSQLTEEEHKCLLGEWSEEDWTL